jgi:hypothetical protein
MSISLKMVENTEINSKNYFLFASIAADIGDFSKALSLLK